MHSLYAGVGLQILGGYSNFLVQPQNGAQFNFVADEKARTKLLKLNW